MVSPVRGAFRALVLCELANGVCAVAFPDHTAGVGTNPAQGVASPATASATLSTSFMILSCFDGHKSPVEASSRADTLD